MNDINTLVKLFEQFAHTQNYAVAFDDLINYFLLGFQYYETEEQHNRGLKC